MKYGTELQKRSVPQWRAHNIDYNEIKDLIKQATLPDAPSDILDRLVSALLQEYESVSASRSLHQTVSPINPHEANSSDEKETSPFAHNSVPQSGCPRLSEKPIHLFVIWKRSKKRCSASQKVWYLIFGEADPGGLGRAPKKNNSSGGFFSLQNESKRRSASLRRRGMATQNPGPHWGSRGVHTENQCLIWGGESKSGEIDRRIDDCEKLVDVISEEGDGTKAQQNKIYRLHRDVIKITSDLRSLSRFIGAQRTGFRKLLKKYKKWAQSDELSVRILPKLKESPDSFVNLDLSSKFIELSLLYDVLRKADFSTSLRQSKPLVELPRESLSKFDCEMVTSVTNSSVFWVHQDNFLELKVLLLQNLRVFGPAHCTEDQHVDKTSVIYLDDKTFHSIQSDVDPGQIRWVDDDDRILCTPTGGLRYFSSMKLSEDQLNKVLDGSISQESLKTEENNAKRCLGWIQQRGAQPVSKLSYSRTRFQPVEELGEGGESVSNMDHPFIWAVLDNDIKITKPSDDGTEETRFPHAVLEVRWKGMSKPDWVKQLEIASHLVKPMPHFSLYAHSVAVLHPKALEQQPEWMELIENSVDIRRSPEDMPKMKQKRSAHSIVDTPAVHIPTGGENTILLNDPHRRPPPLDSSDSNSINNSPPGKEEPVSPPLVANKKPVIRYWNEFDDPEDNNQDVFTVEGGGSFEDGFFSKEKVDQIVRVSDRFIQGLSKLKGRLGLERPKKKKRYVRLLGDDDDVNSIVNSLEIDDDDDDEDEEEDEEDDDEEQHLVGCHSKAGYDTFPDEEEQAMYLSSNYVKRRDAVLTFLYSMCFLLSSLMTCILLGVIAGEDIEVISMGTFIFIIAGLLFALAIGILGMCLFLLRELPSWWHQTVVFSIFFSLVCFGVGAIAWLL
ncbi:hypothetical protein TRICI_002416 [Trichomonascus ciferrii]|uniref:SPX domain-containing protein n=1 Tax=Trichomonascus ciferrii TaxID=44093 RepID=A0A642V6M5_9ASCO|nr:hypothetical protein TRICI_002416 [Trichomonascus ciferrii]